MKIWQTIVVCIAVVSVPIMGWKTFRIHQCRQIESPLSHGLKAINEFYLTSHDKSLSPLTPERNAQLIDQMERKTIPTLTRLTLYDSDLNEARSTLIQEFQHWLSIAKGWHPEITAKELDELRGHTGRVEGAKGANQVMTTCWIENTIYNSPLQ